MKFIWAIMEIYRRNLKYISDYWNISAQIKIYQRFLKYLDLSTKHEKRSPPQNTFWNRPPTILFFFQKSSVLQE
ncbi:hypothetical protein CEW46_05855 [Bacillus cereus]|nr:hypothetical protein CEW46_05855 [Bacillus cereus]